MKKYYNLTPDFSFSNIKKQEVDRRINYNLVKLFIHPERLILEHLVISSGYNNRREQRYISRPQKRVKLSFKIKGEYIRVYTTKGKDNREVTYNPSLNNYLFAAIKNEDSKKLLLDQLIQFMKANGIYKPYVDTTSIESIILSTNYPNIYQKNLRFYHIYKSKKHTKRMARKTRKEFLYYLFKEKGIRAERLYANILKDKQSTKLSMIKDSLKVISNFFKEDFFFILERNAEKEYCVGRPNLNAFSVYGKRQDVLKLLRQDKKCTLSSALYIFHDIDKMSRRISDKFIDFRNSDNEELINSLETQFYCVQKLKNIRLKHDRLSLITRYLRLIERQIPYNLDKFKDILDIKFTIDNNEITISMPDDTKGLVDLGIYYDNCVLAYEDKFIYPSLNNFVCSVSVNGKGKYCVQYSNHRFCQFFGYKNAQISDDLGLSIKSKLLYKINKITKEESDVQINDIW